MKLRTDYYILKLRMINKSGHLNGSIFNIQK
jgi:hypothetical protein